MQDDREINPDVLGYIFEKYINQKQMGAYYTKEDITEYISKNTIIPFLFDEARKKCRIAFDPTPTLPVDGKGVGGVWSLLVADPDRYIYEAVRKGTDLPLPPEIAAGIDDVSQRGLWNTPTPEEYALPTEIWRETVARRQRYEEIRNRVFLKETRNRVFAKNSVSEKLSINDFITYNLDIQQFAQDVIENCEGPELLRAFWQAINQVTVLDPTCGSGAFLFAALNILEPLYEACLNRMEAFVAELAHGDHHPRKYKDFREVLEQVNRHPNQRYFIFKSIVVNNLYGVDIMAEAVEIAKLRLFLKLVAQVDKVDNIEPLPDIDFNIRAGNTLVGYATYDEVKRAVTSKFDFGGAMERIEEKAQAIDRLFGRFQKMQTAHDMSEYTQDFIDTKEELRRRLKELEDELNHYLAGEHGVDVKRSDYEKWIASHKPFHWFIEFYGILNQGGFDVIIGNPPYVSTRKIEYSLPDNAQYRFPDIYAYILIRSFSIRQEHGGLGMIVPLSVTFSNEFEQLREELYLSGTSWSSSFDNIPAAIFAGVSQRCTILISRQSDSHQMFVSPMYRWRSEYRQVLTDRIEYTPVKDFKFGRFGIPKLSGAFQYQTLDMLDKSAQIQGLPLYSVSSKHAIGFSQAARNFISVFIKEPPCIDAKTLKSVPSSKIGYIKLRDADTVATALSVLSGELYFWYWLVRGDGFDVTSWIVRDFISCLKNVDKDTLALLSRLGHLLHARRFEALVFKKNAGKYVGNFNYRNHTAITRRADLLLAAGLSLSRRSILGILNYVQRVLSINVYAGEKGIPEFVKEMFSPLAVDEEEQLKLFEQVDEALRDYYDFTAEELDFIINYDIKFRMGQKKEGK